MTESVQHPSVVQRYIASTIDAGVVFLVAMLGTVLYQGDDQRLSLVRTVMVLAFVFVYEPLLTTRACTAGQYVVGIRVRDYERPTLRISLARAYLRWFVKMLFGLLSFFTVGLSPERRALHDFAARSIVFLDADDDLLRAYEEGMRPNPQSRPSTVDPLDGSLSVP